MKTRKYFSPTQGSKDARFTSDKLWTYTDVKVKAARYTSDTPEEKVARFFSETQSISPNSHHIPSVPNRKFTRFNVTHLRMLLITKTASQEPSLKHM